MPCACRLPYGKDVEQIVPPQPPDLIMGGPQCRSRREARTLRPISTPDRWRSRKRLTPTRPNREGTAIWLLAQLSAILPRHPDRMLDLLRKPVSSMIQASIGPSRSIAGRTVAPPAPSRPTTKPGRQNAAKIDAGPPSEPAPSVPHSCAQRHHQAGEVIAQRIGPIRLTDNAGKPST